MIYKHRSTHIQNITNNNSHISTTRGGKTGRDPQADLHTCKKMTGSIEILYPLSLPRFKFAPP